MSILDRIDDINKFLDKAISKETDSSFKKILEDIKKEPDESKKEAYLEDVWWDEDDDAEVPDYDELYEKTGEIPPSCSACGGPYPLCRWGCNLHND